MVRHIESGTKRVSEIPQQTSDKKAIDRQFVLQTGIARAAVFGVRVACVLAPI
jgi:hypothetical protein